MFVAGILIHLTFLFSIFDIYFKSPIVKDVVPYQPKHEPLADRLVLFVVDGLRAESFVNYTTMTYLRSVANSYGRWGISNTQVPTESRPGHVALIAGFYEDPSAVAKGWKENPVDFDSVFNQSTYTWCWGTYDIVNIFTKGHTDDHIEVDDFDPYDQSFSPDKNTSLLDGLVFDKVKHFFETAKYSDIYKRKLKRKKLVFFLHLLGTDTAGHTHKPKTMNFLQTLSNVDKGVKEMEAIFRDYYSDDGKTTFLMTSDHGMTDWGSHGAGDDHETQTPYVIWGSGVQTIAKQDVPIIDPVTKSMSLEHRFDINQVDLAPLMSTLLSIPVPVNSIGKLPTEILDMSLPEKAKALYSNSRQLASQYNKKRQDIEENMFSMLYQPYEPFHKQKYTELIEFTEKLLHDEDYENLIILSQEIINLSISGLNYYHNYYQVPLLVLVTLAFMGWILYLLKILSEQKMNTQVDSSNSNDRSLSYVVMNKCINILFTLLGIISIFLVYAQQLPQQYYLYSILPIVLWWRALSPLVFWVQVFKKFRNKKTCSVVIQILNYTVGCIAMSLSFTHRWILSLPLLAMGLWPFFSVARHHLPLTVLIVWPIGCILLSIFSFMPVVGKEVFIELVIAAGILWLIPIIMYVYKVLLPLYYHKKENDRELILVGVQTILLLISLHIIYVQSKRFEQGKPIVSYYQTVSWMTAGILLVLPLAFTKRLLGRLTAINTSIITFYLLLSVAHEGLFIVALVFNVTCWIFIEFRLLHSKSIKIIECSFEKENDEVKSITTLERGITSPDFRRAFFFILYIVVAFFGTGNIASLNSFEVRWVTCFITSFQPFVITTLILLKTLAPFLCVACSFQAVQHLTKAPGGYLNIIVLLYSNLMGIQLLYNVKNTGSWLEIGTSISQFVIVQVITLFIVLINQIAKFLTEMNIYTFVTILFRSKKKYV